MDVNKLAEKAEELKNKMKMPGRGKLIGSIIGVILLVVCVAFAGTIIEDVGANDILVVKSMGTGNISVYKTPGWKPQLGGEVVHLKKSFQYWFSSKGDQGMKTDQSLRARFNDNGHANISGSIRIDLPLDDKKIIEIYTRYGSQQSVEHELVRPVLEKAVYFSGPLMSSTESASAKRNMLLGYIEDQAQLGVYRTTTEDVKVRDPITGAEKTTTIVKLVMDEKAPTVVSRQEPSQLQLLGLKLSALSINEVKYDEEIEKQIASQQKAIMDVQIAMAESRKAEQRALTVAKEGEATAAKAKWEQETIKAREVTKAEQEREVARIGKEAAEFTKQKDILLGQGEAERKRLVMMADGALTQKLATYERVAGRFAQEFGKQKWVSEITFGGTSSAGSGGSVAALMEMITASTAKNLGLDMSIPTGKTVAKK